MNAQDIKDILTSYIKASSNEVRIYKEKSVGRSICDVMAVTDHLTGYEIKSDLDNYTRLKDQIMAYNWFFDENYLVVGESHVGSADRRVPDNWGILCVTENNISMVRRAKKNLGVSRRAQLSVLWKLELKNLLIKNNLPAYAQKEKGFIADRLVTFADNEKLGKQIAYELLHRDYSVYDAKDLTEYSSGKENSDMPIGEIVDMLSEENLSNFTLDRWIDLYKQAAMLREQKDTEFKKPVKERTPHAIPYTDIEVALGVPWVNVDIVNDFICHLLDLKSYITYVEHEDITGNWYIQYKNSTADQNYPAAYSTYGLKRYNALYIIEATLNLREIKLFDNGTEYNEADTLAALEKQKLINEEFKRWVWEDEDRRWLIEEAYNSIFGGYKSISSDGSKLTFPHMSPDYSLYPYQMDAVQRILDSKNTLLAFDVGAGKTYIMIAAAMKMRQMGLSRKNFFVVPNHIVGQWEKIFEQLYPGSRVLAVEPKSFKPEMRQKVLGQIRSADYDGIIMAYSCFEMIPLTADSIIANMSGRIGRIEEALNNLKNIYCHRTTVLRAEKEKLLKLTNELTDSMCSMKSDEITFEDLEIDTLFLDEAHNYKNLPIKTNLKNLRGINTTGSRKCQDMLHKVRTVQHNGRGVVFATGTPLCNSVSDAYAMQVYLQHEELEKSGLEVFDNWVKTFAHPEQICEIDVDVKGYRMVRRFSRFFNLPELSAMFSHVTAFHANDRAQGLPDTVDYTDVKIKKSKGLSEYMKRLAERTENIRMGMIDRKYDNMLKVSTDGRKAALDLTLVGWEQPYDRYSKIFQCVENVSTLYHSELKATQLIFCDYSTPKAEQFNVYSELKKRLVEQGIPSTEIAFIHSYQTESRKVELFKKFNAGEMRVLIGSTFKLGIGANVQQKLKAIHHLDVPWRPADMVQREGRIIRRGNENKNVRIFRYITEGSFDSYSWQLLETKQRFISQFLSGSTYQRSVSDLENNVLTYAEVKALALAQPLMKKLAKTENELKTLKILKTQQAEERKRIQSERDTLKARLEKHKARLDTAHRHAAQLSELTDGEYLDEMRRIHDIFSPEIFNQADKQKEIPLIAGFKAVFPGYADTEKPYIYLEKDDNRYAVILGDSAAGNAKRIVGKLKRFDKTLADIQKDIEATEQKLQSMEEILKKESVSYDEKIRILENEVKELTKELNIE